MYLRTTEELETLIDRAHEVGRIGVDAEFIRERTYFPKLALVQLSVEDECVLLDPLGDVSLEPLDELIVDPGVTKILHAASQDLEIFYYRSEQVPAAIFDTQIAAAMIGLGNQIAYGALVERCLGISLAKGESFTDWLRRPLTSKQEEYALDDVRHLFDLHDALMTQLRELGREEWVAEEFRRYESLDYFVNDPNELYRKVKRFGTLDARGQAVLRELAMWREQDAMDRDKPRRAAVPDETMIEIARRRPKNHGALHEIRGCRAQTIRESGKAIAEAVQRGTAVPDEALPNEEKRKRLPASADLVADFLHAFLKSECQRASISSSMVGTAKDVQALVRAHVEKKPATRDNLITGWRGELVGRKLEAFLDGKISMRVDPQSLEPVFEERK
ncbi:MAG: ribonuclease D [Planctomycetota bacterium]